jgi:hypothetical protein
MLLATEYAHQAEVLDQHYQATKTDLYVAKAILVSLATGRPVSICVWPDGVSGLLPRTNVVSVTAGEPETPGFFKAYVRFEDALRIGAGLIHSEPVPFGPVRFAIRGSFSEAQRAAFQAAALDLSRME